MSFIHLLDESTINQIAAGEVVERPSAVVKELIENSMDAGANAITVEIKEGGLSFIRITDNGAGISKEDIPLAFLRHATSKIKSAEDLLTVTSLGFRGEALSSIAAVAQVELITKTSSSLHGYRYIMEGGVEKSMEEIGCPGGTTILVRNLFYNTPARRKFLKSPVTEAGYICDLMERLIVSHPAVSFKFIMNNQVKMQSSGNNSSKDILYHIYGRDIIKNLLPISYQSSELTIEGFIGKPVINRGNRNFENYFINGRYIKSPVITRAIEDAYKPYVMQHKYPFTSLYLSIDPMQIDVNVHPQKLEIRLKNSDEVYQALIETLKNALAGKELIPDITLIKQKEEKQTLEQLPEPFEENRRKNIPLPHYSSNGKNPLPEIKRVYEQAIPREFSSYNQNQFMEQSTYPEKASLNTSAKDSKSNTSTDQSIHVDKVVNPIVPPRSTAILQNSQYMEKNTDTHSSPMKHSSETETILTDPNASSSSVKQLSLFSDEENSSSAPFLSQKAIEEHRIIGQVFATYWLVEYRKELFIIDQHAAHEKVLFERLMKTVQTKSFQSQMLLPPIVLTLSIREQEALRKYEDTLSSLGYEIEPFGGNEFSVRAVPADVFDISEKELLLEFIDDLTDEISSATPNAVLERAASLSCKAAVKANHVLSYDEANALIKELLTLENPYHCPHGRPVIVSMSQYELEKKFKRII
ncbi:MAG: mutL [Herbinix sp.]|jgi:DNA mismatch repair protein MutL|nr:mutL [Herbinix sp.]